MEFFSPAKINLTFRILGNRPDGFHEIDSLFQAISLGDRLSFSPSHQDQLLCSSSQLPTDRTNLVWKAVDLFREKTGALDPLQIDWIKQIPHQAGLGGGSSNAATTLWALNALFQTGLSTSMLQKLGGELGSDVPFFFSTGRALCRGRGEIVFPKKGKKSQSLTIAKPYFGLSTAKVYEKIEPHFFEGKEEGLYFNDLEKGAFILAPILEKIQAHLYALGFSHVVMTGSGSAFFCLGDVDSPEIDGVDFYRAKTLMRSPLDWYKFPH